MSYFLRQDKRKNRIYLQMYERYWNKELKQARTRCIESFGYVDELKKKGITNPINYYNDLVQKREQERLVTLNEDTRPRISDEIIEKNLGYFLYDVLLQELGVKKVIDILASVKQFQFNLYDLIRELIVSRIIDPCSKSKTVEKVFPKLYNYVPISEDQVNDGLYFIGSTYKKYIELFNSQYEKIFPRNLGVCYFDCTNYYFEIDMEDEIRKKGPSKENRQEPIIGQALLLDENLIPYSMELYPGNMSEKPFIRKLIEDMKTRSKVRGKTIQVADKGLNCARNIYAAVKEAKDGYIFSKSVHGKNLSEQEKAWVLMEDNNANKYTYFYDSDKKLKYKIKSCIDNFKYSFTDVDLETGEQYTTTFIVKEKRIVSYNPDLARKQKAEIQKEIDKATKYATFKAMTKEELGSASKYLINATVDDYGNKIKPRLELNQAKIEEEMRFAGYNLIVTSETHMSSKQIFDTYHNLWKIEECFRLTKSYLDARPVYAKKEETIYAHFLICYLGLFLTRVLEIKCFNNTINAQTIINFAREFKVARLDENKYINLSFDKGLIEKMKNVTDLTILDALYLTKKEVDDLFKYILPNMP